MMIWEAQKIYNVWKEHIEILNKVNIIFSVVPESFLPYPVETLEEALNMVIADYVASGNTRMAENIKELMAGHLGGYFIPNGIKLTDEEVLIKMRDKINLILENSELKESLFDVLKDTQSSWIDFRK